MNSHQRTHEREKRVRGEREVSFFPCAPLILAFFVFLHQSFRLFKITSFHFLCLYKFIHIYFFFFFLRKDYMVRYGYLHQPDPRLEKDLTNDDVTLAVKNLQHMRGLAETGSLQDPDTAALVDVKRCAVPDFGPSDTARRKRRYAVHGTVWNKKVRITICMNTCCNNLITTVAIPQKASPVKVFKSFLWRHGAKLSNPWIPRIHVSFSSLAVMHFLVEQLKVWFAFMSRWHPLTKNSSFIRFTCCSVGKKITKKCHMNPRVKKDS